MGVETTKTFSSCTTPQLVMQCISLTATHTRRYVMWHSCLHACYNHYCMTCMYTYSTCYDHYCIYDMYVHIQYMLWSLLYIWHVCTHTVHVMITHTHCTLSQVVPASNKNYITHCRVEPCGWVTANELKMNEQPYSHSTNRSVTLGQNGQVDAHRWCLSHIWAWSMRSSIG